MVQCDDIYCRIKGRKRLEEMGYTKEQATEIAQQTYEDIKKIVEKYNNGKA